MGSFIAAIDQGTTSTRCMIFSDRADVIGLAQAEHRQIYPRPGWVEHDPIEIWNRTREVIARAIANAHISPGDIAAVGVTNQRETTVFWDRHTGRPYGNAIVWQDTRTREMCDQLEREHGHDRFRQVTGLPVATYFSGPRIRWALEHVPGLREAANKGDAICGTIDSWLIWQLTGGTEGPRQRHVTDVTNASRTLLMDLRTRQWDPGLLDLFGIPESMLPRIAPSADPATWGSTAAGGPFGGARIPVCGAVGDQQAALIGQGCFDPGDAKNTYGTGCFMLLNTGEEPVVSKHGLLTTMAYQFGEQRPCYALEGSIAVAGSLVQWLRDNLRFFDKSEQIEALAREVDDSGGVYIVPAFSGLFAPYWRSDARGVIVGLTSYVHRGHLCRAALESVCFQTREILDAMRMDSGVSLNTLRVDGGMVANDLLMQFQADILDAPVSRPQVAETTSLGAACAAGLAVGLFRDLDELRRNWSATRTWTPHMASEDRDARLKGWKQAVQRSFDLA